MALILQDIKNIINLLETIQRPIRVLSFCHPDILATPEELAPLFGGYTFSTENGNYVWSAYRLFNALSVNLTIFGLEGQPGVNEILDLNYPVDFSWWNSFDLIIDPGTFEHVFNVGICFDNVVKLLKVGGFVYHVSPMTMINHGYWNFSPVAFRDFYVANGFEIVGGVFGRRKNGDEFYVPFDKMKESFGNSMLVCLAQKIKEVHRTTWPMQEKYMVST